MSRKRRRNKKCKSVFLAGCLSASIAGHATSVGVVGGAINNSGSAPYVVLLPDLSGSTLSVSGLPNTGVSQIDFVDINQSGLSLIGGRNDSAPYAAFVSANNTLTPLSLGIGVGDIFGLSVNDSNLGLLGVHNFGLGDYFSVFVTPDGTVNSIPIPETLFAVDLNNNGVGLIGGEGGVSPYAAFVVPDGTVTPISLSMGGGIGRISRVAINDSGNGIVIGFSDVNYAAFVYSNASSLALTSVTSGGALTSAAINNSGIGLIGGRDVSLNAYAVLVALDGTMTSLISTPFTGNISSVALNDSGIGLIGGQNGSNFYAAFVQPNGSLTPLFSSPGLGSITSVAINNQGVGLIGGETNRATAYAALVAPNGTLTSLDFVGISVNSVALADTDSIINQVVPVTLGSYNSIFYSHLSAVNALGTRVSQKNRAWSKRSASSNRNFANNQIDFKNLEANLAFSPKVRATPKEPVKSNTPNSIWFEPFGDFLYLSKDGDIPKYNNKVGGALLGYDRQGDSYLAGISGGYVFNYVDLSERQGHAKIQEEFISLYGSWYTDHFWMGLALSGGPYQATNVRHFLGQFTSKGKFHGWVLDPHLEIASPWAIDKSNLFYVEPFAQFDWINNWQNRYTETGATGFNLKVPDIYNSLLQSEAGLRFYQQLVYGWGKLCFEEKVSYINQAPFDIEPGRVSFIGSASTFPVAQFSSKTQNLGSAELLMCFVPQNPAYPYGGFSFEGTGGSSYQSYFSSIFLGVDF